MKIEIAMTHDDLLSPKPTTPNDALREAVLARTAGRLRIDRRMRRVARLSIWAGCFLAGIGVSFFRPVAIPDVETRYVLVRDDPPPKADPPPAPPLSPAEMELKAEQILAKAEAARLFRDAGDRYYRDYGDYRAALRCYRNFLDEADPADLVVRPDDTALLTSLKNAREMEKTP